MGKRTGMSRLIGLFAILLVWMLCACTSMKYGLYEMAIDGERAKAGLSLKQTAIGGKSIAFLEGERAPGKSNLVLIHGFGANKDNWVRFAKFLTDFFYVVAVDLPGHGDSVKDPNLPYDLDDQVGYLNELLAQLGIREFHISGNSMGGAIAALYAARYPEQVRSLMLMAPGGIYQYESDLTRQLAGGKNPLIVTNEDEFDALMDFVLEKKPFLPWPMTSVMAEKAMANRPINEKIFDDIRGEHRYQFQEELKKIAVPTLIIWGRKDRVLNVENAAVFEKLIPRSRKVILEDIGHVPMVEDPGGTAAICRLFMEEHESSGRPLP
ncbi:MAG: alpha/beta fold hydrolase [Thermodesulfobacteriota bacterium]